jgi:hypothetical protein
MQNHEHRLLQAQSLPWPALNACRKLATVRNASLIFKEHDYTSGDGMQTSIFGPVFWTAIHLVSFNYPVHPTEEQKRQYKEWLDATGNVLPCVHCRTNFQGNMKKAKENFKRNMEAANKSHDADDCFASRDTFSRFCFELHQEVNRATGKDTNHSFEVVRDIYEGFRACCHAKPQDSPLKPGIEKGCIVERHRGTGGRCVLRVVPTSHVGEGLSVSAHCRGFVED